MKILVSTIFIFALMPFVVAQPKEIRLEISTSKYQYEVNEEVVVKFVASRICLMNLTVSIAGLNKTIGPLAVTDALNERSIGAYATPGRGLVEAKAWNGQDTFETSTFFIVIAGRVKELFQIPAGGKNCNDSTFYETLIVRDLNLNDKLNQTVEVYPEEIVHGRISLRIWNDQVRENKRWQIYIIYSWSPAWPPPNGSYTVLYDNVPGEDIYYPEEKRYVFIPAESVTIEFDVQAPYVPGEYYMWLCYNNRQSAADGIGDFVTPLSLPAHIKIIVLEKKASSTNLRIQKGSITLGENITIEGTVNPPATSEVNLLFSLDNSSYRTLAQIVPLTDGSFSYVMTPTTTGVYFFKATTSGDRSHLPSESMIVKVAVNSQPPFSLIAFIILAVTSGSSLVFLILKRRRRVPSKEDLEKHIEVAKRYLQEKNQNGNEPYSRLGSRLRIAIRNLRRKLQTR